MLVFIVCVVQEAVKQQHIFQVTALKEVETPKVYDKILRLTFDVAMSSLVGFNIQDEKEATNLFQLFCDFASNVICLPLNIPGLGFHKVRLACP